MLKWASCINSQSTNRSAIHFVFNNDSAMPYINTVRIFPFFQCLRSLLYRSRFNLHDNDTALTPRSCSFLTWSRLVLNLSMAKPRLLNVYDVYNLFKYLNPNIASNSFGNGVINKWFPASVVRYTKRSFFSFIIDWKAFFWWAVWKLSNLKILQTCW
jgi:hypothetical protein